MTAEPPTIVVIAGAPYHGVRRSARSLSEALTRHATVVYADPSTSPRTGGGIVVSPRANRTAEGVNLVPPVSLPAHTRPGVATVGDHLITRAIRRALSDLDSPPPAAVILQTPQRALLGTMGEAVSVYWATDHYTAGAGLMGVDADTLAGAELRASARADLVVGVSPAICARWSQSHRRVIEIGHGVSPPPPGSGQRPPDLPAGPVAAVVGTLSNRIDPAYLAAVADSGITVALIGPLSLRDDRSAFDALLARPDVHWLGQKRHDELGDYYAHVDVGLVPYTLSEFNRFSSPLKHLEYLAAGLPVVATPLPAILDLGAPDVSIAGTPSEFAEAALREVRRRHDPSSVDRRRASVASYDWDRRARQFLEAIDEAQRS